MKRITDIYALLSKILTIKESKNRIGSEHFGLELVKQNFPRYGVCTGKQILVRPFILGYFQQKVMTKLYENSRKPHFGLLLCPFCPFQAKHISKFQLRTDGWTDGQV